MDVVDTMLATLADGRILSWSRCWPYLTGDQAPKAEPHARLADRPMVAVTPTGPFAEATLADPRAAYIAMRTVSPGAAWQGIPALMLDPGQSCDAHMPSAPAEVPMPLRRVLREPPEDAPVTQVLA